MDCGFMSWDVPTDEDCPSCGKSLFKKSGKGRMKPFCINEECVNFLPEDQRGYRRRVKTEDGDPETAIVEEIEEEKKPAKKTAAKKTAAKKTTKKTAAKKPAAKKTTTQKTTKKAAKEAEEA